MDVARVLAVPVAHLHPTDVPADVLEALRGSAVREVHLIGRRGPEHGKFTTKELRELGELDGVTAVSDPDDLPADDPDRERHVAANLAVIATWVGREPADDHRLIEAHFWRRPVEILGTDRVEAIRLESSRPDGAGDDARPARAGGRAGRRLPQPPAARAALRRGQRRRAQRRDRSRGRRRRSTAARRVRRRLDQARPHRCHRHEQGRRHADRPRAARRPGGGRVRRRTPAGGRRRPPRRPRGPRRLLPGLARDRRRGGRPRRRVRSAARQGEHLGRPQRARPAASPGQPVGRVLREARAAEQGGLTSRGGPR